MALSYDERHVIERVLLRMWAHAINGWHDAIDAGHPIIAAGHAQDGAEAQLANVILTGWSFTDPALRSERQEVPA